MKKIINKIKFYILYTIKNLFYKKVNVYCTIYIKIFFLMIINKLISNFFYFILLS